MPSYWLVIGILGVWRVTHLLTAEDGPWDLLVRMRRIAGTGAWGRLLDCFYCLSLWLALPTALLLGDAWTQRLLLWPALSGGACLLERLVARGLRPPVAPYLEEEGGDHGMLREQESTMARDEPRHG